MKNQKILQTIGIIICTAGAIIIVGTLGLGAKLGLPIIIAGLTYILTDWTLSKYYQSTLSTHLIATGILTISYVFLVLNYTKSTVLRVSDISKAHELAIICGAKGYDPLPDYIWWTRTVGMPIGNVLRRWSNLR